MLPGIKWEVISGDVTDKLDVKVTEEILMSRANSIARQQLQQYGMYNMDDETVADMARRLLADRELRRRIEGECEEMAMFDAIRAAVTIDSKEVSLDEFRKLAQPEAEAEA